MTDPRHVSLTFKGAFMAEDVLVGRGSATGKPHGG
jgi:hypothetical protein